MITNANKDNKHKVHVNFHKPCLFSNKIRLQSRTSLALILVPIDPTKNFRRRENFEKKLRSDAIDFVKKIIEIGATLAIFESFEV